MQLHRLFKHIVTSTFRKCHHRTQATFSHVLFDLLSISSIWLFYFRFGSFFQLKNELGKVQTKGQGIKDSKYPRRPHVLFCIQLELNEVLSFYKYSLKRGIIMEIIMKAFYCEYILIKRLCITFIWRSNINKRSR